MATDDAIDVVLDQLLVEWHSTTDLSVDGSKSTAQKKKQEAKLKMTHLDKKRKKEVVDKAQAECQATQQIGKYIAGTEQGSNKGARSPSPETEKETNEKHSANPQATSARIKCPRELEIEPKKKSKVNKTSMEPITLTEVFT